MYLRVHVMHNIIYGKCFRKYYICCSNTYKIQITDWKIQVTDWKIQVTDWKIQVTDWKIQITDWKIQVTDWKSSEKVYCLKKECLKCRNALVFNSTSLSRLNFFFKP